MTPLATPMVVTQILSLLGNSLSLG